jgi:hypothetical protein
MKDNKYLGSWDLEVNGKYEPRVVTIEKVFQDVMVGEMGKEDKVFIKLKEFQKSMVANRTNFKTSRDVLPIVQLQRLRWQADCAWC